MNDENPDFLECVDCLGEFYKGDLDADGRCSDCEDALGEEA